MRTAIRALGVLLLLAAGAPPCGLRAQQPTTVDPATAARIREATGGRPISQAEILERLRQSGMSRAELRARLQALGMDPSLGDRYFDAIESGGEPPSGAASQPFVDALERAGIAVRGAPAPALQGPGVGGMDADSANRLDELRRLGAPADSGEASGGADRLEVFGRSLFRRATNQFSAAVDGPVDAGYRLGAGDEVSLVLTGDVQQAYTLTVTPEGYLILPDAGEILVNGLTIAQLEDVLYSKLSNVYSGVRRGPTATTHFQVSMGRVHTTQVYLIGEVMRPGAYQVSALSTVFNALYLARGPTDRGSFRRIEVRRRGKVIRTIDLYEYLLHGNSQSDLRLEQGDIIFVPTVERQVKVLGAVRRSAIFELLPGERLGDVLTFAGGLEADAVARRVQIDRILPPAQRRDGVDRVLVDVDLAQLVEPREETAELQDGDIVQVFAVSDERRHRVVVTGEVRRPGVYEWAPGATLWQLLEQAQGLDERAYRARAHVFRLNLEDGGRRLIRTELRVDSAGRPTGDLALSDRDSVVIFSREELKNPEFVTIDGFIKRPGTYPLAEGMTLKDLILSAGGFIRGALLDEAEIARLPSGGARTDTTAVVLRVPLTDAGGADGGAEDGSRKSAPGMPEVASTTMPGWAPLASEFRLRHGDRVFVRKAPGYAPARQVKVTGEVMVPGTYVLTSRQERLAEVVRRSGGLTKEGYAPGFQLVRRGSVVPTDLQRALREPESRYNIVLEPDDSLYIPPFDPTVLVTGAVAFESRVLYRPGKGLDYYIQQAGGYADRADKGRVTVAYQDGERAVVHKFLVFRQSPEVRPGATVVVPKVPESKATGFNWDSFLTRTLTLMTTTATLLLAIRQLN